MKKSTSLLAIALLLTVLGCGASDSSMTKQEEQDFKGKPIPPGVLDKMKANSQKPAPKTP